MTKLIAIITAFSLQTFAQEQCPQANSQLSATCGVWNLTLTHTNHETGAEQQIIFTKDTSSSCKALAQKINDRLGSTILYRSVIIASCEHWNLHRVLATTEGRLKGLSVQEMRSTSECKAEEERLNNLW